MIEQFLDQKVCLACKGCCRFAQEHSAWGPALLKEEAAAVARLAPGSVGKDNKIKLLHPAGQECFFCPFLDIEKNACRIYACRPFECQLYPFVINTGRGKVYLSLDCACPGLSGKQEDPSFKSYAARLQAYFSSRQMKELLKGNPQIIQSYENTTDLFELTLD